MRTIKITIEYDGTDFSGWQVQPGQRTVQGEIEAGLFRITQEKIRIMGSGRTDAGVHALGQVASFPTKSSVPIAAFQAGLSVLLPEDIRILKAEESTPGFNARKDARRRVYRYVFAKKPSVIGRRYAWFPRQSLALDRLSKASRYLMGIHDFAAFSKLDKEAESYEAEVFDIRWMENSDEIHFEIEATRFFHNMIRILLGTLLELNRGKISEEAFKQILTDGDRTKAGPTIPPQGLFLVRVDY